jgi:hypothetical protein
MGLDARGHARTLRELERDEPELASFLMEGSTAVFARLARTCDSTSAARSTHRRMMGITLTCIEALRRAAWQRQIEGGRGE